jgi:hypothetical protein
MQQINPSYLLLPFCHEQHPDHIRSTWRWAVNEFFTVLLSDYNQTRGNLAVKPFQAAVVAFCNWTRVVHLRNGAAAVLTLATLTPEVQAEQMLPNPLAGETARSATSSIKAGANGELVTEQLGGKMAVRPDIKDPTVLHRPTHLHMSHV